MVEHRTHNEPSFSVTSHPKLPLYVTGSTKGCVQVWKFDHDYDCALDEYTTTTNWKENYSNIWNINKLKFNPYGDKLAVNDVAGNLYLFGFGQRVNIPETALKGCNVADFSFLNQGTILVATGLKPKPQLVIFDTLMPPRRRSIIEENIGGNIVLCMHEKKEILLFNQKPGEFITYDIRMMKRNRQIVLFNNNIV